MMPHTRYDDVEHLKAELEQERRYRDSIEWSNTELERSITELTAYLDELDTNSRAADDNEWKVRFDSQTTMNKSLQDQKDFLETELTDARRRLTTGTYPEAMNFNLDALNEPELLRLVKHLERMRNDLFSTLRDSEWKMDKEGKEFHHFDEMRRAYKGDLKHANSTIEKMRQGQGIDPSGSTSPMYPPQDYYSYMDNPGAPPSFMDSSSPGGPGRMGGDMRGGMGGGGERGMRGGRDDGGMGMGMGGGSPKKGQKKGGGGGGGGGKAGGMRGMDESPTRSKSRADKKTKKKEAPAAEECYSYSYPRGAHRGGRGMSSAQLFSESDLTTATESTVIPRKNSVETSIDRADTFTISVSKEEHPSQRKNSINRAEL